MANMPHCRFYNTVADLRDCYDHMDEHLDSLAEIRARAALIKLCQRVVDDYGEVD